MNAPGPWALLSAAWQPRQMLPPGPADALVITDALRIRRLLGELARSRQPLALLADDGQGTGTGLLEPDGGSHGLMLRSSLQPADPQGPFRLNATGTSDQGMVMFTLAPLQAVGRNLWQAPWPGQLVNLQSRRHPRVGAAAGLLQRALLQLAGHAGVVQLRDLSEEGIAFDSETPGWLGQTQLESAQLLLDGLPLSLPLLQVVSHQREHGGRRWRVGARLLGMAAPDRQRLRQWIAALLDAGPPAGPVPV